MIKQLRKVGNSTALILDRPLLELLGLTNSSQVQLVVSEGSLRVTPVNPHSTATEEFTKVAASVLSKRRKLLRRLAQ